MAQPNHPESNVFSKNYNPRKSLSHLIGDYKSLSPWNKMKFNLIQWMAEWHIISHNIKQQQTMNYKYKYSDPYLDVSTREIYHPIVAKSMKSRFRSFCKGALYSSLIGGFVVYPAISKILEVERKRRDLYLLQKSTYNKQKSI